MLKQFFAHITVAGCILALGACASDATSPQPQSQKTTLNLEANDAGDLEYCESDDDCRSIPNPDSCERLIVEIDTATGETCERCEQADGTSTYDRCQGSSIACTVVTAPDPDCVVCAHIGGSVLYSSCVVEEPTDCEDIPIHGSGYDDSAPGEPTDSASSGQYPERTCRVCYDGAGNATVDECGQDCSNVICPAVACAPGYRMERSPDDCCGYCVPVSDCDQVVCADSTGVPDCPPGTRLNQDPFNCCGYTCEPIDCSAIDCPAVQIDCPRGSSLSYDYPNCCGTCIPDSPDLCQSDDECGPEAYCSSECLSNCSPGEDGMACTAVCYGRCIPDDHICPQMSPSTGGMPPFFECEGEWVEAGRDDLGCPLPPKCVCADGQTSIDGRCGNLCGNTACFAPPPDCGPGTYLSTEYPNCCGICLSDDRALCAESGGHWNDQGCGNSFCGGDSFCDGPTPGCQCGPTQSFVPGRGCVEDPSCTWTQSCQTSDGASVPPGESFPSADGCNTCVCLNGAIACTEMACNSCWGAWTDDNGTCRSPNDGVYPDSCCATPNICTSTGGRWDETSCGDYSCGEEPMCEALIPGCDCGPDRSFDPAFGCRRDEACQP